MIITGDDMPTWNANQYLKFEPSCVRKSFGLWNVECVGKVADPPTLLPWRIFSFFSPVTTPLNKHLPSFGNSGFLTASSVSASCGWYGRCTGMVSGLPLDTRTSNLERRDCVEKY